MKFTPELVFGGGRIRPLVADDVDALFELYQHPDMPGQAPAQSKDPIERMIDLSVRMAATQRGMMWILESGSEELGFEFQGQLSLYDWQASLLRGMLRMDALASASATLRADALQALMDFMAQKYHVRNFGCLWVEGQTPVTLECLHRLGFEQTALERKAWRFSQQDYADIRRFHLIRTEAKPVPARLGEQDNPGQNLEKSFFKSAKDTESDSNLTAEGECD